MIHFTRAGRILIRGLLLCLFLSSSFTQAENQVYTSFFSNKAVSGYDAVAYFKDEKAVKGSSQFVSQYLQADWYFANQENLLAFEKSPNLYAPQYGGHCTWAMSQNKIAAGDPNIWALYENKLYLFYAQSGLDNWRANKEQLIKQANANWLKMDKE
jgi:YHS domain-containing protein